MQSLFYNYFSWILYSSRWLSQRLSLRLKPKNYIRSEQKRNKRWEEEETKARKEISLEHTVRGLEKKKTKIKDLIGIMSWIKKNKLQKKNRGFWGKINYLLYV